MIRTNLKPDENSIFSLYKHNRISSLTHIINQTDEFNQTLLYLASFEGDIRLVKDLLKYGANPNIVNVKRWSPLHSAIKMDNTEISKILINNGANLNCLTTEIISPLTQAVIRENFELVKYIVERKCNINLCDNTLMEALLRKNIEISRYLLENGIEFKKCHHKGYNSLQICFLLADYELFKLVLTYYLKN